MSVSKRPCCLHHVVTILLLGGLPPASRAVDFFWDANPDTGGAQYGGTTGVWTSATTPPLSWNTADSSTSSASVAWVNATNSMARFGSGTQGTAPASLTLSLGENITLQGIDIGGGYNTTVTVTNDPENNFTLNFGTANGQIKPNNAGKALTIDVVMLGSNGITKSNGGTAILAQDNLYTGGTNITAGVLQVGNGGTTGSLGGGNVALGGGTTLRFSRSDNITFSGAISGSGTLNHATASMLTLDNAASNVGRLTLSEAGTVDVLNHTLGVGVDGATGISVTVSGVTATVAGTGGGKIAINSAGMDLSATGSSTLNINAALIDGLAGSVDITSGTVVYGAANTYTGLTNVTGGTLRLASGTGPAVRGDIAVAAGATLTVATNVSHQIGDTSTLTILGAFNNSNRTDTVGNVMLDTTSTSNLSGLTITGTLTVTKGTHDMVNSAGSLSSHTTVLGGNSLLLLGANSGNSTWTLGPGGVTLTGTTIRFGNQGNAIRTGQINLQGDVTASGNNDFTIGTGGAVSLIDLQGATRTFNVTAGTTSIAPVIQGAAGNGITKTGAGTLVLYGANTYSGKTTISGGELSLAEETPGGRAGNLTASPWIQVDAGATFRVADLAAGAAGSYTLVNQVLSGTGTVAGELIVGSDSTLRPGGSSNAALSAVVQAGDQTGQLTTGNLTLTGGASSSAPRLLLTLNGTPNRAANPMDSSQVIAFSSASSGGLYDSLLVEGTLSLDEGSFIKVELGDDYQMQWGDVFNILDWSATSLNLNADGAGNGFTLDHLILPTELGNGWSFETDLFWEHGIIYVAPEPSRMVLLMAGLVCLLLPRRRRA